MPSRILLCLLVVSALAACSGQSGDEPPPNVPASKAFANIPLPPDGMPIGSQGSSEAMQILISSPHPADSVLAYYRKMLSKPPYQLISESTAGDTTTFYVTTGNAQPMWIGVEGLAAGGTLVRLVGAPAEMTDSTGSDSTKGT